MKQNKSKLIAKKKTVPQEMLAELRKALLMLKIEQKAGRLLKTHQIKKIRKEIARILTKNNQEKLMMRTEQQGEKL